MAGAKKGVKHHRQVTREQMKEYGDLFKSMRVSIGFTLTKMADAIGVHYTVLSRWEKGTCIPQVDIKYVHNKIKSVAEKHQRGDYNK